MADDIQLDAGTGGVYAHTKERTSTKHNQVVEINIGGASEALMPGGSSGVYVQGPIADGTGAAGNPVLNGAKAVTTSGAFPTAVDADDVATLLTDLKKRLIVAACDPGVFKTYNNDFSTAQTGTALITPGSGKRLLVTHLNVMSGGSTAGIVTIWGGGSADTTWTVTTDLTLFRHQFYPASTNAPGAVVDFSSPVPLPADYVLRITTSAAITCYVQAFAFEY